MPRPPKTAAKDNKNTDAGTQLWSLPNNIWHREDGPHLVEPPVIFWGQNDEITIIIHRDGVITTDLDEIGGTDARAP